MADFGDRMASWSSSYAVERRPYRLNKKLKLLEVDITLWNKEVF